jgi:endonuclease-3
MPQAPPVTPDAGKEPFDIDAVFERLRRAVAKLPKAAMFDLRDRGYGSPFEQLVGSLISARTRDETTVEVCLRLFAEARTPQQFADLPEDRLVALLNGATFPEPKARDLKVIARQILDNHGGLVPDSLAELTAFRGVGPKIAALTLAVGFDRPAVAVDVHVHRITNRWGYVATTSPERTMLVLEKNLPQRYWIEINERLVPFGKFICTAARPKCSTCLLLSMCRQVGVANPR